MDDEPPEQGPSDPFGASSSDNDSPVWEEDLAGPSGPMASMTFAADVAKIWVQEHQKASMLGAFAVGVFVGALLRD